MAEVLLRVGPRPSRGWVRTERQDHRVYGGIFIGCRGRPDKAGHGRGSYSASGRHFERTRTPNSRAAWSESTTADPADPSICRGPEPVCRSAWGLFDHLVTVWKGHREAVAILMTIGLVFLAIVGVVVVLAWAEWRSPPRDTTAVKPRLTTALLATEDEEALR